MVVRLARKKKNRAENETNDGIITLRDICGRAEIEIRDEGFRRRAQSADTKRGGRDTHGDIG